jgi:hypothetical protein
MAYPSITNTFASGATAIHSQWNTNFSDLVNGLSDGTKDSQIYNLSAANAIISGDLYSVAFTDYSSISDIVGWASYTTKKIYYKKIGKLVQVHFSIIGTGDSDILVYFTLPYVFASFVAGDFVGYAVNNDNGTYSPGKIVEYSANSVWIYSNNWDAWTPSAARATTGNFFYEAST